MLVNTSSSRVLLLEVNIQEELITQSPHQAAESHQSLENDLLKSNFRNVFQDPNNLNLLPLEIKKNKPVGSRGL